MLSFVVIFLSYLVRKSQGQQPWQQVPLPSHIPLKYVDLIRNGILSGLVEFIPDSDVIDPSGSGAMFFICPQGKKCNILCQSGCAGRKFFAGPTTDELLFICEGNACQGVEVFTRAEINHFSCLDPGACAGANFTCGARVQPGSRYLPGQRHLPQIEACITTCSNGGCSGNNRYPGTNFTCLGAVNECRLKGNSFNSFKNGTFSCLTGPGSICTLECSTNPREYYCTGAKYNCGVKNKRQAKQRCRCGDYCTEHPNQSRCFKDCPRARLPNRKTMKLLP